jgi:polyphosphate kinase 2 (PPK2 family)
MSSELVDPIGLKKGKHLDDLEHKQLDEDEYKPRLKAAQVEMLQWQHALAASRSTLIVVFEGPDAGGKGGAIKRLTERLDPRTIRVHSIVRPSHEEYQRHYLWRFWNRLPPYGQIAIFDRSWYGRVLVERVEEFASDREWKRAYQEINQFERMLADDGAIFVKIYLHISKDEQLFRFKRREADPMKHWKITEEDWRNRKKWSEHNDAAEDMFQKTSTETAPWHVIGANYKWLARVKTVETVVETLKRTKLRKAS